jgi:hypothetical protein
MTRAAYRTLLASGTLVPLAMGGTMIMHGYWQSALVALAGLGVGAFLTSLTLVLAIGERPASPAPSTPRRRPLGQRTDALDVRRGGGIVERHAAQLPA